MNNDQTFKTQLRNLVKKYSDELFTKENLFYSYIVDLVKDSEDEKMMFKKVLGTGLFLFIYQNRNDKEEIKKKAITVAKNKGIKEDELLDFISDLLYSLGIDVSFKEVKQNNGGVTPFINTTNNTNQNTSTQSTSINKQTSVNTNQNTSTNNNVNNVTKTNPVNTTQTNNTVQKPTPQNKTYSPEELNALGDEAYKNRKYEEAFKYYFEANKQGNLNAKLSLGKMYLDGIGTPQDIERGFKLIKEAAKKGLVDAYIALGDCYHYGKGVKTDFKKGFKWYKKAAKAGHVEGYFNLGVAYTRGWGVSRLSKRKAKKYFRLAADLGHPYALEELNDLYKEDDGNDY